MAGEQLRASENTLGPGGAVTSLLGLGSWNTWDRMDFDEAVELIEASVASGVTLFDVAHYNTGPHAEQARTDIIFGEAVRSAGLDRERFQICGKLWLWEYPESSFEQQMTTSLERIGTPYVDTVVLGDYMSTPDIPSVVTDVAEQISKGRLHSWGVNNWPADDLDAAFEFAEREGMPPPSFAQLKYSVVRRSLAEGKRYGSYFSAGKLALQASDIFEGGILLGKKYPDRKIGADPGGIRERIRQSTDEIARVAAEFGTTASQLAIAYCLCHPATRNVLFGVRTHQQLADNLGAPRLAAEYGSEITAALEHLWLDTEVSPDGT